jgi:Cytochrome c554 and c-prime
MRRVGIFTIAWVGGALLAALAATSAPKPKTVPRSEYLSDSACAACHKDIFDSYERTAHHLTSQIANKDTIAGTFQPGADTMTTANPNLMFRMEVKAGEFFQTAVWGPAENATSDTAAGNTASNDGSAARTHTERLDLVIGSGGKGQTYLYWKDDQLFQLPAGYSTVLHRWINSPGYEDGVADFNRGIIPRCLECHAGYFHAAFPDPDINMYDTKNFALGITCDRCHGPERKHVAAHAAKKPIAAADEIINPAKLSAARQADVCAQCHGGQGDRELMPAFSYVPGQPLNQYIDLGPIDSAKDVDVHGKQGKLLMKSRCYQMSANLNCSTCHDVHKKEPNLAAMSQHCLSCHKIDQTPAHLKVGEAITQNCIDCHMPSLESKVVYLNVDGKKVRPRFRSHWIKIYSAEELQ